MRTILAYGDSLTWGYDAEGPRRHRYEDRWPSVLQSELGDGYSVVAEGLNGRTTAFDDHLAAADRNGARLLPTILTTHGPFDLLVLLLGSNDMKPWIAGRALAAKQGMERLVDIAQNHPRDFDYATPAILLVAPPPLSPAADPAFAEMFSAVEESRRLARQYAELAELKGCGFFDAGSVARTTPLDGVHLDRENTRAIGRALAPVVRSMLGG